MVACFKVDTGDVEDAPALDPISKYEIVERDGAVYIKTDEETIKANRRFLNIKCSSVDDEKVVVIGGYILQLSYMVYANTRTAGAAQSVPWKVCEAEAIPDTSP